MLYASETVKMPLKNGEETWFKAFYTPSQGTAIHTWYGFYNPAFLDSLYQDKHSTYDREVFLKNTYNENRLFNGISAIELNCTLSDYFRIGQELANLRCNLLERNGDTLIIQGGDIKVTLSPSSNLEYSHISKIHCDLNHSENSTTHLGNVVITNNGNESIWDLNQLHKNNSTNNNKLIYQRNDL